MKIKDVFDEIIVGYNITNAAVKDKCAKMYKTLQKDSIQYTNIIDSKIIEKAFSGEIKEKYFIKQNDILIFVKKPYRVGICIKNEQEIILPNNFVLLRGIHDTYSAVFVANYLEKIGIKKHVEKNSFIGNLTVDDIKKIDLPDISKEKQMTISPLLHDINERSAIYSNILDNDQKIIHYALHRILGDEND